MTNQYFAVILFNDGHILQGGKGTSAIVLTVVGDGWNGKKNMHIQYGA